MTNKESNEFEQKISPARSTIGTNDRSVGRRTEKKMNLPNHHSHSNRISP